MNNQAPQYPARYNPQDDTLEIFASDKAAAPAAQLPAVEPAPDTDSSPYGSTETGQQSPAAPTADQTQQWVVGYAYMQREIRSWGRWMLLFGVLSILTSGIYGVGWGVLLLIVGALSFWITDASLFVIYGFNLAWAALSNLTGGATQWLVFGLIQIYMSFRVFSQFFRLRGIQTGYLAHFADENEKRFAKHAATFMPLAGFLLSAISLVGLLVVVGGIILVSAAMEEALISDTLATVAIDFLVHLGVLGFGTSLAALLSKHRNRVLAILGLVTSTLVMLGWIALLLLGN